MWRGTRIAQIQEHVYTKQKTTSRHMDLKLQDAKDKEASLISREEKRWMTVTLATSYPEQKNGTQKVEF